MTDISRPENGGWPNPLEYFPLSDDVQEPPTAGTQVMLYTAPAQSARIYVTDGLRHYAIGERISGNVDPAIQASILRGRRLVEDLQILDGLRRLAALRDHAAGQHYSEPLNQIDRSAIAAHLRRNPARTPVWQSALDYLVPLGPNDVPETPLQIGDAQALIDATSQSIAQPTN